jgi:hypothetical protein
MDMCNGTKCPLNNRCLRATGDPNRFEGWFMQVPYDHKDQSCKFFMEDNGEWLSGGQETATAVLQ